jgi:hypothetical protein
VVRGFRKVRNRNEEEEGEEREASKSVASKGEVQNTWEEIQRRRLDVGGRKREYECAGCGAFRLVAELSPTRVITKTILVSSTASASKRNVRSEAASKDARMDFGALSIQVGRDTREKWELPWQVSTVKGSLGCEVSGGGGGASASASTFPLCASGDWGTAVYGP